MSVIKDLKFELHQFKLEIPFLEISDSGLTAIFGPSGSGKTTFFKILIGLYQPENWSWNFGSMNLAKTDISDRQLGVVFQNYALFPHLTAEMNIQLVMKSRKNNGSEVQEKLAYFKNKLNLNKCWQTVAQNLSGGEQQRVSILRAIMSQPRMILLDEPFSALDQKNKTDAYEVIKSVLIESKVPALMITHNYDEACYFTDQFIRFENGLITI